MKSSLLLKKRYIWHIRQQHYKYIVSSSYLSSNDTNKTQNTKVSLVIKKDSFFPFNQIECN